MSRRLLAHTVVLLPWPACVLVVGAFINRFGNFLGPFLVLNLTSKGYSPGQAGLALGVAGSATPRATRSGARSPIGSAAARRSSPRWRGLGPAR